MIDDMKKWIGIVTEITFDRNANLIDDIIDGELKNQIYRLYFKVQQLTNHFNAPARIMMSVNDMSEAMLELEDIYQDIIKSFNANTHACKMADQLRRYLYNDEYGFDK